MPPSMSHFTARMILARRVCFWRLFGSEAIASDCAQSVAEKASTVITSRISGACLGGYGEGTFCSRRATRPCLCLIQSRAAAMQRTPMKEQAVFS